MSNQALLLFKLQIYQLLATTHAGELISYGELAKQAGYPNYARHVAKILKDLPDDTNLPWYRVIKSNGVIAFAPDSDGFARQKDALENEGWIVKAGRPVKHNKS